MSPALAGEFYITSATWEAQMLCDDLNGKEIQNRGDICIRIGDSLCCTAEHTTQLNEYIPLKIKKKKKTTWLHTVGETAEAAVSGRRPLL